ncbi:MAG: extracellular solute-binding protein [Patescibacteria group bacterium]
MKKKHFYLLGLSLTAVFILTAGFGCKLQSADVTEKMKPIELNYWRVYDDQDAFTEIIDEYQNSHPNIKINYRKLRPEEYEKELLDALAEDRGPDIFSIDEGWLKKYQNKIQPMPPQISMAYRVVKGAIKKEVIYELRVKASPSLRQIKSDFADTVYKNAILDGQVYGLPISLESLVMFVNKDILNRSGVTEIPTDWKAFQEAVQKITKVDSKGNIIQSGAAMGTGNNVDRSFDLLSVLMMQNGAQMTTGSGMANFFNKTEKDYNPGLEALRFYTDFASPVKSVYSWNEKKGQALDGFISGQVGFTFGYNYHLPIIRSRAPKLNLAVAPIPQVNSDSPINYANYYLETVSKKSAHPDEAWDFIIFATGKSQVEKYLNETARPTALKSIINKQLENEDLYAASVQTLTAANWYEGKDLPAAQKAFNEMINQFLGATDEKEMDAVMKTAIQKINQTMN